LRAGHGRRKAHRRSYSPALSRRRCEYRRALPPIPSGRGFAGLRPERSPRGLRDHRLRRPITVSQFDDLVGTNLRAPLFLSQAAATALRASQGLILNLVDIHGRRPLKAHPVYSAAKAGLIMLTKSLARELGPEVRVNGIAPGPVLWPERGLDPALKDEIIARTALKRSGSPDDIARTALYLATEAPYVTGEVITVDGGRSI
jgi:pteridine reductase